LGITKPTTYLVLLGNDTEMRANGGFAGSYAKISLSTNKNILCDSIIRGASRCRGASESARNIRGIPKGVNTDLRGTNQPDEDNRTRISLDFQDIYVPDGQVKDYTEPPYPIQQAFGTGSWQLANADWEPDFPTAAKALRWFFEKGKETNPDILAIINLSTIKEFVGIVGSFSVFEFDSTITPENLYLFLQGKAEIGFFPGSTQKKDALYAVGQALFKKIKSLPVQKKFQLAKIIYEDLVQKNIVVNSLNPDFQDFLIKRDYAGVFASNTKDTYRLIETNLGANKANAYVTRQTTHEIDISPALSKGGAGEGFISHKISVKFHNSSPEANPNPPFHYGGNYIAYLRFYIPQNAQNIQIARDNTPYFPFVIASESAAIQAMESPFPTTPIPKITNKYNLTEIGFFHVTQAGGGSSVEISYDLPLALPTYSLTILKQHGMVFSPQKLDINGQLFTTNLSRDYFYTQK
jgi:hypothetical protein